MASKAALYREILRQVFGVVAAAVQRVRDAGGPAETQLAGFIDAVNSTALANPQFPPIWLREMADAGRHYVWDSADGHSTERDREHARHLCLYAGSRRGALGRRGPDTLSHLHAD